MNNNQFVITSGKIFIGGLSSYTTQNSLRKFFEKFGEVDDALVVFDKICNKSRGFGFVTMKDPLRTEQILKNQPHIIDGKLVECRIAVSKEEMFHHKQSVENNEIQSQIDDNSDTYNLRKIFVGGLPPLIQEKEMSAYFQKFGDLSECTIMYDKNTGRQRGFGFILFKNIDSADKVMKNKNLHKLMGKWVECKRAQPKEMIYEVSQNNYINNNVSFLSKPINKESKESLTETKILISQKLIDYKENYPPSNYFSYQFEKESDLKNIQKLSYDKQYNNGFSHTNNFKQLSEGNNNIVFFNQINNFYQYYPHSLYQYQINNDLYSNYNSKHTPANDKNLKTGTDSNIHSSILNNNKTIYCDIPIKSAQNSFSNITEESINEYMENFRKMRQIKETSKDDLKNFNHTQHEEKFLMKDNNPIQIDSTNNNIELSSKTNDKTPPIEKNENISHSPTSCFVFNENELGKKMNSASLSYYFDFKTKNTKIFKLNLFDNFPYKFENSYNLKLFDDNEEENLIYSTSKIVDTKSEDEEETINHQNYFGPFRSIEKITLGNLRDPNRDEKRRYKPY